MGGTAGPGTNLEQLFAAGYAACFRSAVIRVSCGRKLDVRVTRRGNIDVALTVGGATIERQAA
jgi:organic hydroperoxide reductase OsmC/OhrA